MKKVKVREDTIKEAFLIVGFLGFSCGVWMIYPPASLIIGGALMMWLGYPSRTRREG
ncbi:hypothetical protein [Paenibacillus popilliae]|uniref:hypothetical protein n=1 Tax=Paenibacillus popilliae TaxID=78057 RepID=UPI00190198C7|nr:hypothetical protein [Paenibacillus popilliae]